MRRRCAVLIGEMLTDENLRVIEAEDGAQALARLKENPGASVLLSDVKMPRMGGYALVEAALKLRPELKVLMMTGYDQDFPPPAVLRPAVAPVVEADRPGPPGESGRRDAWPPLGSAPAPRPEFFDSFPIDGRDSFFYRGRMPTETPYFTIFARWPGEVRLFSIEWEMIETKARPWPRCGRSMRRAGVPVIRTAHAATSRRDIARAWLADLQDKNFDPDEDVIPAFIGEHLTHDAIAQLF